MASRKAPLSIWANEGMAVLAEPRSEDADLHVREFAAVPAGGPSCTASVSSSTLVSIPILGPSALYAQTFVGRVPGYKDPRP